MKGVNVRQYCNENLIDISMFATEGDSNVSTEDSLVVDAIQQLLDADFTYAAIASALRVSTRFVSVIKSGEYLTKPARTGRTVDTGKIGALRRAGWSDIAIAGDMNLPLRIIESVPRT